MSGDSLSQDILPFLFAPAVKQDLLSAEVGSLNFDGESEEGMVSNVLANNLKDRRVNWEFITKVFTNKQLWFVMQMAAGASSQFQSEMSEPGNDIHSISLLEESIEGSLMALLASVGMLAVLRTVSAIRGKKTTPISEVAAIAWGGLLSQSAIFFVGDFLHSANGWNDVPTLEILKALLKI